MTDTQARGLRLALAAKLATDYTHDSHLPFATAELAARWALEAYVKGWAHVPGSQVDESPLEVVPASLLIAEEALHHVRRVVAEIAPVPSTTAPII